MNLNNHIKIIDNYPKDGVKFKDITPLMLDGEVYKYIVDKISDEARRLNANLIVGPEARGFIAGCPVAYNLGIGFVPIRKPNKLPRETISEKYDLEYGQNELCVHKDDIKPGDRVLIVDDILATGGTMEATIKLIKRLGGEVVGLSFILDIPNLGGMEKLSKLGNHAIQILESE